MRTKLYTLALHVIPFFFQAYTKSNIHPSAKITLVARADVLQTPEKVAKIVQEVDAAQSPKVPSLFDKVEGMSHYSVSGRART